MWKCKKMCKYPSGGFVWLFCQHLRNRSTFSASKLSSSWCSQACFAHPHHTLSLCSWCQWQQPLIHAFITLHLNFQQPGWGKKNSKKLLCTCFLLSIPINMVSDASWVQFPFKATDHSECCQQFQENRGYWSQWMLSTIPELRRLVTVNAVNNSTIKTIGHSECCQQFQN